MKIKGPLLLFLLGTLCTLIFADQKANDAQVQPPQPGIGEAGAQEHGAQQPPQRTLLQANNDPVQAARQPQQQVQQQNFNQPAAQGQQSQQQSTDKEKHLVDYMECREDIHKYCTHDMLDLKSDMALLECLQDAGLSESVSLTAPCENLVWQFKVNLTQDERFRDAAKTFCREEMTTNLELSKCAQNTVPGYALSCMLDYLHNISKASKCFQFLSRTERLAFSDFRVVGPFVSACRESIERLNCGSLTPPTAHASVRVPHSQGLTMECLIRKMVEASKTDPNAMSIVTAECRHQVMRIAELQSDDFHLDRQLFFACREDRERFCKDIPSGNGKVFECLLSHKSDQFMEPECARILNERAVMMGHNFRLSHPLLDGCGQELRDYGCAPQPQFQNSPNFHLSWVLLCLENAARNMQKTRPFSEKCQHEMATHRKMMMSEFRLSPEVVLTCGQEIDRYCSPKGDIEAEGRTLHCLMGLAQSRGEKKIGPQCMQALSTVIKVADIGSNYKVDKVLYASCQKLIDGPCAMDAHSESSTLTCLMRHVDGDMPRECEQRLLEVQYFMARDWTLDPELYKACHEDAVAKCSANPNWHVQGQSQQGPDPGPVVLACLYRSAYDESNPLKPECMSNVRRVLHTRAVRVNLIPDVEDECRNALSEYCSGNVQPTEEMKCLQEHFEEKQFKTRHPSCYRVLAEFTKMEAKDTALNRALTRACKPVISAYCKQYVNEDIDHGDVMECLYQNKDKPEMTPKCRSYVNHFELISLRDYHFSYKFEKACKNDIEKHCRDKPSDKAEIIRCLSSVMFEHRLLGTPEDLDKDCKKQLKVAYLQQEQVNFDDKDHMKDADPALMDKCSSELERLRCDKGESFEDIVECLRINFDALGPECKAVVFAREKIEAMDNRFDDELQQSCRVDIARYCHNQEGDNVLDCLTNTKVFRILSEKCQTVVRERMREKARDVRLNPGLFEACKHEAEQYCPDDYKKINDPQYEKKTLEGVFVSCLRTKYANPRKEVHLSAKCKDEIAKVILESELDVQSDPMLFKACKNTIEKHCSNAVITYGGGSENVLECLKTDLRQGAIREPECARQISRRLQESLVDIHLDPVLYEACATDVHSFCNDVPAGQSRLIICLMDAMKESGLRERMTTACKEKLTQRNELWTKAHQEHQLVMPESFAEMAEIVANHPHRTSILTWFTAFVLLLLGIGCCCGRATKRIKRELKNR